SDTVARDATGLLIHEPARGRITRGFLEQPARAQALHKPDHPPDVIVADAYGRHLCSWNTVPNRRVQLRIAPAMAINACGEIGAAAPFTERAMTVGAMGLKERFAGSKIALRGKRIGIGNR